MDERPSHELVPVGEFGPFDLLSDRAHDLYLAGACDEAVQLCYEGLALVEATDDVMTQRYLRYIAGISLNEDGRNAEAVAEAGRLLATADAESEPYWRAKALALLAEASISLGEMTRAMDALAEGTYLLACAPSSAYNHMSASMAVAIALRQLNLFEQADELLMSSVHHRDAELDMLVLQEAALLRLYWAATLDLLGLQEEALRHYLVAASRSIQVERVATEFGHGVVLGMAVVYQGYVWERLGQLDLAERLTRAAVAEHVQRDDKAEANLAHLTLGRVLGARGRFREAREHLDLAVRGAQNARRDLWAATGLAALAAVDEAEVGPHPGIERWRVLARELLTRVWHDREGRWAALQAGIRVRELLAEADRAGQEAKEDPLTRLGNRRRLVEHVSEHDAEVSVLFVDIDHFKEVNDTYSHEVGDQVLVRVAGILSRHCRGGDVIIRYGGDEFVVLVDGDHPAAAMIANRILDAVRSTSWGEIAPGLRVTVSMGLATSLPAAEALSAADTALYSAKRAGRDRLVLV
ncbi:MAG: diguanylate cyclase [Actinomycetes bacterium]